MHFFGEIQESSFFNREHRSVLIVPEDAVLSVRRSADLSSGRAGLSIKRRDGFSSRKWWGQKRKYFSCRCRFGYNDYRWLPA